MVRSRGNRSDSGKKGLDRIRDVKRTVPGGVLSMAGVGIGIRFGKDGECADLAVDRPETRAEKLAELTGEHAARLVLFARQRSATPEDVVQEALLKLFQQQPWPGDPVAWLYRVVRNLSFNANRSRTRRSDHEAAAAARQAWFQSDPDGPLDARLAAESLVRLDPEIREVVVLKIWCGHSYSQIAALTGSSPPTAMRRFQAGLNGLRKIMRLEENPPECGAATTGLASVRGRFADE